MTSKYSRRQFIKDFGVVTGAVAAPVIVPSSVWSAGEKKLPNDRINIAVAGIGKQGTGLLRSFLNSPDTQIVAVCDVDRLKLQRAQQWTDDYYSEKSGKSYKGCQATVDIRDIFTKSDIDAVILGTPDHWHAIPSIWAVRAGMDVYCEKPLSLTITEARDMVYEVRRNGRVFQTGSMQRSSDQFRHACELVRNGYIGDLKEVCVSIRTGFIPHPIDCDLAAESIPKELEWDLWQGQTPDRPYNAVLAPPISFDGWPAWRNYRAYSGGGMTDWGAHHFDIAQWGMGVDESGPVTIIPARLSEDKLLTYYYANGVKLTTDFDNNFIRFTGSNGIVEVNRSYLKTQPESLVSHDISPNDIHLYASNNHHQDFINAIRNRTRPISDVEIGARSVTVCHLGNLAHQLDRVLTWNPDKEEFVADDEANRLRTRAKRSPWMY